MSIMDSVDLIERWAPYGVIQFKIMPNGELAGVKKQLFTFGIITALDWESFRQRWCYERSINPILALHLWNGENDPPGPWLKTFHPERHNPLMCRQRPDCLSIFDRIPNPDLDISAIWPRGI